MFQGRLLSYPDAQRYRLGGNYEQIPVNSYSYATNNHQRDGAFVINVNGESSPNYFPNSLDEIVADPTYKAAARTFDSLTSDWFDSNGENDHFTQPEIFINNVLNV